jgi:hypothetical protein
MSMLWITDQGAGDESGALIGRSLTMQLRCSEDATETG